MFTKRLFLLSLLLLPAPLVPLVAQRTIDTTITVQFRIRATPPTPTSAGTFTTSVTKAICTGRVDTVRVVSFRPDSLLYVPPGFGIAAVQVDTTTLHIYDWPSRVGEFNVYMGPRYLGRLARLPGAIPTKWYAYQYWPGMEFMPRQPLTFADSVTAMRSLATATSVMP